MLSFNRYQASGILGLMKMIEVKSYRDLTVCQKSMALVVRYYQLTSQF